MNIFRRIIGLLMIIFFGLPLIFGIIWAVGLTKAAVSPEFVTEFPQKIIAEIPVIIDEVFEEAQKKNVISDPNTRAWFEAAASVEISPRELIKRIGLEDWMDHELSGLFEDVEDILRGTKRVRTLVFDLRPLKDALLHEDFFLYIEDVLDNLPLCDEIGQRRWDRFRGSDRDWFSRKACRPDRETMQSIFADMRESIEYDIPDDISLFRDVHVFPLGISRVVVWLSYSLFLFPAAVLFLAALIAATSPASFFRWSGISILSGGLIPLVSTLFFKQMARWALFVRPYSDSWSTELQNLIVDKTEWIHLSVIDFLFSPVVQVAGVVCVVGVILFAISFIVSSRRPSGARVQTVPTPRIETPKAEPQPNKEFQIPESKSDQSDNSDKEKE
ncbi:MAG: hypothetical protein MUO43_01120 [Desulfobacterales bacterium]|nr:hypothetical protein [Desulfobacterales bacterium]